MGLKSKLSGAVVALIISGAAGHQILGQFLTEREGNRLVAYQDAGGIWTICKGLTYIDGKRVTKGMRLTAAECDAHNAELNRRAIAWVEHEFPRLGLTEPQKAAIASFCYVNIGVTRCKGTTFYKLLKQGDLDSACLQFKRWIFDNGVDCRTTKGQANGCYGQVERREMEQALCQIKTL